MFPMKYKDIILAYSKEYNVKAELIASVINVESGYDKYALSNKGAKGLMQLIPSTAYWLANKLGIQIKEEDLFNEEINIKLGSYYLSYLINKFDDKSSAIASYNAGPSVVNKWLCNKNYSKDGIVLNEIPYRETRDYLKKIDRNLKYYFNKYNNI